MRGLQMGQKREGMRDRLAELQEVSDGQYDSSSNSMSDTFSNIDLDDMQPQAVVFNEVPLDNVFQEAQNIRQEIHLIRTDVGRLRDQNTRMLSEVTRMSVIRRDSNAIAADIKSRGERVLALLQRMEAQGKELEDSEGTNSAVARVARTQYVCLSTGFRDAMFDYNEAEMLHKENCKANLQRQLEVAGKEVTGEQIEEMIENGNWNVFTEDIVDGKTVGGALNQIERRHKELLDLENRIQRIHELFLDLALLVEEHGPMMNTIEANVSKIDASLGQVMVKLNTAKKHSRNNPFKKMFCGCFPCYK
ncbi:syntaxin-11b.1 [Brienomyrus brachyistius]|uniref:syntaxin-11b.1 n=1 Tax=Brienomyrus brachyistius TaxID=42636 RepID=UPI0020B179B9|nr:syntaxin-11b.1 [Brienomyrus brachyistius]